MTVPATPPDAADETRRGTIASIGAVVVWGMFPLYWRQLIAVPPFQLTAQRIIWCTVFVGGYLVWRHGAGWLRVTLARPRAIPMLAASSLLIGINWTLYIWAANNGHVVEASLGFFINPLVNVLLGVAVLRERLNARQWMAVALAAAGVLWLTWSLGRLPWIALSLAVSFGLYGLIRKLVSVESIPGLGVESVFLFLPALAYLVWCERAGIAGFGHVGRGEDALMIFSGIATAVPLIWFSYAARRIPYSLIGIIQYASPSLQLLIGVLLFNEPFTHNQLIGFGCIWAALGIYAADGVWRLRIRGVM